jgi:hypothetical protein
MISVAQSGVKVFKMKWAGMFPATRLWASDTVVETVKQFFDETKPQQRPLDSMIEKLIDCRSAAEVVDKLLLRFWRSTQPYTATNLTIA